MSLQVNVVNETDAITKLILTGSLDTNTAADLDAHVDTAVASSITLLIIELSALEFISSAGVRSLVKAVKGMKARGGRIAAVNPQPQISKVFEIIQALPDMRIFVDDQEMDEYLASIQNQVLDGDL